MALYVADKGEHIVLYNINKNDIVLILFWHMHARTHRHTEGM